MTDRTLWLNANIATMESEKPYGMIENAAMITTKDGLIEWVGHEDDLSVDDFIDEHDLEGCLVTPGLIDCHTHLIYAGNRAQEFEMRLQGKSYTDIAKAGGGIASTVKATRAASDGRLYAESGDRLLSLFDGGVTTVEIKSGYGLDIKTELKMLEVAKALGEDFSMTVCPTFLGAHALPPEFDNYDDYLQFVIHEMLPAVAKQGIATSVDIFCENIAFNKNHVEQLFKASLEYGMQLKIHAEQLSNQHGAEMAAKYNALSADHLEHLTEAGVKAMQQASMVATLLPGAFYFLRETQLPPIELLRKHHVPIAIATDSNPGTSPCYSLLLMTNMACTLFRMTPEEALRGITIHAAKALGLDQKIGSLAPGKQADFIAWEIDHPAELAYRIAGTPMHRIFKKGVEIE